ncbi:hypothetical protein [Stappia indica]|uniref:hypothetical protein n=1 Tax=Stappia indica TaxID=538381 RepID=UPI001CD34B40|nr:hypothetical protein [Stappia indica]MCA1300560.1 hypothetical protein [Stappia indica]
MHAIDHVVARFPKQASIVRRLYLSDEHFRAVCEDYLLCINSLTKFEARPDANSRPEVAEYRQLRQELELEMATYVKASKVLR